MPLEIFAFRWEHDPKVLNEDGREETLTYSDVLSQVWEIKAGSNNLALWTLISRLRRRWNSETCRLEISFPRGDGYIVEMI